MVQTYNTTLNYIDGFGGIGAYHTKDDIKNNQYLSERYGSPIISAQIVKELLEENKITKGNILIIDKEKANIENIINILKYKMIDYSNINFINGDFDVEINNFLNKFDENLAPTFFMIDPFGFKIRISTIQRIMSFKKTEVFFNFMYNAIQRWPKKPNLEKCYDDLFGCTKWKQYVDNRSTDREFKLVNLFRDQCKKFSNFVYPYRLQFPDKNKSYYYLFHLTNHYKGCDLMKQSFTALNCGSIEYVGEIKPTLFDDLPPHKKINPCKNCYLIEKMDECIECILKKFSKSKIKYIDFIKNIIDQLPFKEADIKKVLKEMEKNEKIVVQSDRKRKGGFKDNDIIIFQ